MRASTLACASVVAMSTGNVAWAAVEQPALSQEGVTADAAPAPAPAETGLADIVVTAQKRSESIQKIPVTVSAFTTETLQNANVGTIAGIQGMVPGMTINKGQSSANLVHVSLRGISIQDTSKAFEPGIGFVLDGVVIGTPVGLLLDSFDVERLEVLRGPQGTLFGRNTTGGALNIVRAIPDPGDDTHGKLKFTVGSFGRTDVEGRLMLPLIKDKLAVKVDILSSTDDGTIYNSTLNTHLGDKNLQNYNVTFHATPTDRLSATLILEKQRDRSELPPAINLLTPDLITDLPVTGYTTGANSPCLNPQLSFLCRSSIRKSDNVSEIPTKQPGRLNMSAATLHLTHRFDDFSVVAITGYRDTKQRSFSYLDGTALGYFPIQQNERYEQFSQELRFESDFEGPFSIIAGGFYFHSKWHITQITELDAALLDPTLAPGVGIITNPLSYSTDYWTTSKAVFAQAEYNLTEKLKLIAGGRYTWDKKRLDLVNYGFGMGTPAPLNAPLPDTVLGAPADHGRGSVTFKKFTPKVAVQYQAMPNLMMYASFSVGYNTGGFNARAPSSAFIGPYRPETLNAYEVGFKSDWFDRRVRLNVSAFRNEMKDKQEDLTIFLLGGGSGTTTVNAAKARYQGIEAELSVLPVEGWSNSLAVGYLDAKYTNFSGDLGQGSQDLTRLKLRRTPQWTVGYITDYQFALGEGTFGLNGALSFVDKFDTNILNDPRGRVPATTKIDLSARYGFALDGVDLKIIGFVKNVTDKHPYNGHFSGNLPGGFFEFAIPEPGRTWGVSLEAAF